MWRLSDGDELDDFSGGGPSLRTCRHCGRRFYSELMPFCSASCSDAYDRDHEYDRSELDEGRDEWGGEG